MMTSHDHRWLIQILPETLIMEEKNMSASKQEIKRASSPALTIGCSQNLDNEDLTDDINWLEVQLNYSTTSSNSSEVRETLPLPSFSLAVKQALRDGRSGKVWNLVSVCMHIDTLMMQCCVTRCDLKHFKNFQFHSVSLQMIEQMFNFNTFEEGDPNNKGRSYHSDYRQIGYNMYKRYPSIKR